MSHVFHLYDVVRWLGEEADVVGIQTNGSQQVLCLGYKHGNIVGRRFRPWPLVHYTRIEDIFGQECKEHLSLQVLQANWTHAYWMPAGESVEFVRQGSAIGARAAVGGCHCKKCGNHFPFAEPNQDDGTLVCWNCRNYPHYKGRL